MILPFTVFPAGISTITCLPGIATLCELAARSTVTTRFVEVVCRIGLALAPPPPEPALEEPPPVCVEPPPEPPEPPLPWPDDAPRRSAFSIAFSCAVSTLSGAINAASARLCEPPEAPGRPPPGFGPGASQARAVGARDALLAIPGGSYAIQEATAPHKLIAVSTGLFAAGYVRISGAGVHPGLQVTNSEG